MKPITKEKFKELAEKHYKNGNKEMQILGDELRFCCCDAPLIRTSDKGGEYCAICGKDLKN